jgi:pseudouridine-5'-phosphate glycosidase
VEAHLSLPGSGGLLLVQPPPEDVALDSAEVEAWIGEALQTIESQGIRAGGVTPRVLAHVAKASDGKALRANIGLIVRNARTAGEVAVALAHREAEESGPRG